MKSYFFIFIVVFQVIPLYAQKPAVFDEIQENVWYLPTEDKQTNLYITHLGKGDTVVSLHGGPGNNFNYLVDAVKDNAQEALFLLYDQRGSIYSPIADSLVDQLSLDVMVDDLETLRKATKQPKLTLFGHSFGTLLAISYYIKYPENVDKIILTATMPPFVTEEKPFTEVVKEIHARTKALRLRPEVDEILKKEGLYDEKELSPQQLSDRFKITGLASFNMIDLEKWRNFKGGRIYYNASVDGAIGASIPSQYDIRSVLKTHPIPVILIQGEEDYIDPGARYWKEVTEHYPSVKINTIEKAGHYPWLDNPEKFAELLKISIHHKRKIMNKNLKVSQSVIIHASPKRVWEVMTEPELIKKFLFGTETLTDWTVGSNVIFQGEYEGHQYKDKGIVLTNNPLKELSYSYWTGFSGLEDKPENYAEIIYTFNSLEENQTEFVWTQRGYANEENRKHSQDSMAVLLEKIKEIAEQK